MAFIWLSFMDCETRTAHPQVSIFFFFLIKPTCEHLLKVKKWDVGFCAKLWWEKGTTFSCRWSTLKQLILKKRNPKGKNKKLGTGAKTETFCGVVGWEKIMLWLWGSGPFRIFLFRGGRRTTKRESIWHLANYWKERSLEW